ncbi:MAG: flagellar biosynthesis protein FlhF [Candidatus Schekmanbacteria bacterium]|nr:flagellar biosynthesis protein FlhF [Candidatus Schekmanbacteria bacterium]
MMFKTYEAGNFEEALKMVKKEMGPEAIIVSSRTKKTNIFKGSFSSKVEIVAAYDDGIYPSINNSKEPAKCYSDRITADEEANNSGEGIYSELNDRSRKNIQDKLYKDFTETLFDPGQKSLSRINDYKMRFMEIGINKRVIESFINEKDVANTVYSNISGKSYSKLLRERMNNVVKIAPLIGLEQKEKKIIALVGPTGVGKTTTAAKIAARMFLLKQKTVGLISADFYRVGATKQLQIYADIMDIPMITAVNRNELINAITYFNSKDIILIDTAGQSQKNTSRMKDIKEIFSGLNNVEIWLLISANIKTEDSIEVFNEFSNLGINGLIYTKLDESSYYENLFNLSGISNLPVVYYTTGQEVPQDIEEASSSIIVDSVLSKYSNKLLNVKNLEI